MLFDDDQASEVISEYCKLSSLTDKQKNIVSEVLKLLTTGTNFSRTHHEDSLWIISAASSGNLDLLKLLIQCGSDPHIEDDAALRTAAYHGYLEMVKYLVEEHQADPRKLMGTTSYDSDPDIEKYLSGVISNHQDLTVYI